MKNLDLKNMKHILIVFLVTPILFAGCERSVDGLDEPGLSQNPEVFIDGFSSGLGYQPFEGSKLDAFTVDDQTTFDGSGASMRFDVPNVGDPTGAFAGAIFKDLNGGRDLTEYNALTFYAKATRAGTINEIGFGNDFEQSPYQTIISGLRLSTAWKRYVIPIPDASKLAQEQGMFWYAEGPEGDSGEGYTFWIDELKYEYLPTLAQPRPFIKNGTDETGAAFVGQDISIDGVGVTFNYAFETAGGIAVSQDITVATSSNFFDFSSSDASVAIVDEDAVSVIGPGSATITASLDGVDATGSVTVSSIDLAPTPPARAAENVISIFSDAYTNRPVNHYNGYWGGSTTQGQDDIDVNGNKVIKYSAINYHGIEFLESNTIDISEMTHFHIDIYVENTLQPADFLEITLQDLGSDNVFGGVTDRAGTYRFTPVSSIPLVNGAWITANIPLSTFSSLTTRANLAQIVFVTQGTFEGNASTLTDILVDNIYFYKE